VKEDDLVGQQVEAVNGKRRHWMVELARDHQQISAVL
jgi:IS1 family transposase